MSIETATDAAREIMAQESACPDLIRLLTIDHQISTFAANRIWDRLRKEESVRLAKAYAKRGNRKPGKK